MMPVSLQISRQGAAELLAYAIFDLFPGTLLLGGNVSAIGFHYDFLFEQPIDALALVLVEERIRALIKDDIPFKTMDMMRENSASLLEHHGQFFRAEAALERPQNIVEVIKINEFYDLCPRPHLTSSSKVGAIKLLSLTKQIRRTSERDINVVRISGTACPSSYELKKFLKLLEEHKSRDHLVLGNQMNLFMPIAQKGEQGWIWLPKGMVIQNRLINYWQKIHEEQKFNYTSSQIECDPLIIHCQLFRNRQRVVQDLPLRYAERFYRHEIIEQNHLVGLFNSSFFSVDRAHIFCTPSGVIKELISSLQIIDKTIKMFEVECQWSLVSSRLKQSAEDRANQGVEWLREALQTCELDFIEEMPEKEGNPKITVSFLDSLGRKWSGPMLGIDIQRPHLDQLHYLDTEGRSHSPVIIFRSLYGSLERLIAALIEHYAGRLPLWITPEHVRVLPVHARNDSYAHTVLRQMEEIGVRASMDYRHDTLGSRVHAAECEKVPYLVIIGDKEETNGSITVRSSYRNVKQHRQKLDSFLKQLLKEISLTPDVEQRP